MADISHWRNWKPPHVSSRSQADPVTELTEPTKRQNRAASVSFGSFVPGEPSGEGADLGEARDQDFSGQGLPVHARKPTTAAPVEESATGEGETLQSALSLLNERGCRSMDLNGQGVVGCWPELDDRDFQEALKLLKMDHLRVAWLDGPTVPEKYRTCRRQVQRLREARRPASWEKWVLSRPVAQRGKISVGANEEGIHASL